jgi:putative transposase
MPRRPLIRSVEFPYHVTNQVNNREAYPLELTRVWKLFVQVLFESCLLHGARTHALVLMPNHFHLLVSCPESDLGTLMGDFGTQFTKRHNRVADRVGHLFRGRYHWSLIDSSLYAAHAVRYVYRNPVRAGLVEAEQILNYPFSTLPMKLGLQSMELTLHPMDSDWVPTDSVDLLEWVARHTPREEEELIRRGLRRREFGLGMDRSTARRRTLSASSLAHPLQVRAVQG